MVGKSKTRRVYRVKAHNNKQLLLFAPFKQIPTKRLYPAFGVLLIVFSILVTLPIHSWITSNKYKLNNDTLALVGDARPELANKLVLNPQEGVYQFNPEAKKPDPSSNDPNVVARMLAEQQKKKSVVGSTKDAGLYSLDLPIDASKGMTFTDNNANISFKMTPMFDKGAGRKTQDRLVYPLEDGVKAVYTVKNNGLKEDIVYDKAPEAGTAEYTYKLELPDSLEARLTDDGGMGIYSADPNLFGNITYGSDYDREKVESARKNAPKDHLVFALPKPVIVAKDNKLGNSSAWFILGKNTLTVKAVDLNTIDGPFSIDPSVVVTSSSEFNTGNNEGNIAFGTDSIGRAPLSGGSTGTWSTTTALPEQEAYAQAAAYNGYLYMIRGVDVRYASINATTGALGAWALSTNSPTGGNIRGGVLIYNGYIYRLGGLNGTTYTNDVQYSQLDSSTGAPGPWSSTTSFNTGRDYVTSVAYNGYMYIFGGWIGSDIASVEYAPINADGTVGTWATTTSLLSARSSHVASVYNGYIYVVGGGGGSTGLTNVEYAPINANGTIGSWTSGAPLPVGRNRHASYVHNGYLYALAGNNSTGELADVWYAPLLANGSVGKWMQTNNITQARYAVGGVAYNGYTYLVSGDDGAVAGYMIVDYAKIEPAGTTSGYATNATSFTNARRGHQSVAYNGYLYVIGGWNGTTSYNDVQYAAIDPSTGTVGTWASAGTGFTNVRRGHASVVYNGYLYVLGGENGTTRYNDIQYTLLNANGTIGTWSTAPTGFTDARWGHNVEAYNGYIYVIGGWNGLTGGQSAHYNQVQYAQLSATGALATNAGCGTAWCTTTSFTNARRSAATVVGNGYVYLLGGYNGSTTYQDVQYALICTGTNSGVGGCTGTAGTFGTWVTSTTNLPRTSYLHDAEYVNGHLYFIGGTNGPNYNNVHFSKTNADGTIGAWIAAPSFANVRYYHATAYYGGNIYITGGYDDSVNYNDVQYAQVNNGGSGATETWASASTNFNTARNGHTSVINNGYLYVLGGTSGANLADVQYAQLTSTGAIATNSGCGTAWCTTTSFNTARRYHTSVVVDNFIYVIGGYTSGTTYFNDVQYAQLTSTGAIATNSGCGTAWCTTTSFNTARRDHTSVINNGYLYVLGGSNGANLADVQYAQLTSTGAIATNSGCGTAWCTTTSFNTGRGRHTTMVLNGYMYVIGGSSGTSALADVQYAPINANGSIGLWSHVASFATARYYHSTAANKGYIYLTGGWDATNTFNDVQFVSLRSIPRVSRYSKLVDLGSLTTVSNINYTGTLPGGKYNITFKAAGEDGVFGASRSAASLNGTCGAGASAKFVLLSVLLDDSQTGVFSDSTSALLQDITVDYIGSSAVDPAKRLRGGKYFDAVTGLQLLDTAKSAFAGC